MAIVREQFPKLSVIPAATLNTSFSGSVPAPSASVPIDVLPPCNLLLTMLLMIEKEGEWWQSQKKNMLWLLVERKRKC